MAFVGEMRVCLLLNLPGQGDVFGNKNGASSAGESRTKSEQSEGVGAVSDRAAGAVHRGAVLWCGWCREKKRFSWVSSFESTYPKDISSFLLKWLPFASLGVKTYLCLRNTGLRDITKQIMHHSLLACWTC
jgi:hypothetical protein